MSTTLSFGIRRKAGEDQAKVSLVVGDGKTAAKCIVEKFGKARFEEWAVQQFLVALAGVVRPRALNENVAITSKLVQEVYDAWEPAVGRAKMSDEEAAYKMFVKRGKSPDEAIRMAKAATAALSNSQ